MNMILIHNTSFQGRIRKQHSNILGLPWNIFGIWICFLHHPENSLLFSPWWWWLYSQPASRSTDKRVMSLTGSTCGCSSSSYSHEAAATTRRRSLCTCDQKRIPLLIEINMEPSCEKPNKALINLFHIFKFYNKFIASQIIYLANCNWIGDTRLTECTKLQTLW